MDGRALKTSCALLALSLCLAGCATAAPAEGAPPPARALSERERSFVRDMDTFLASTLARFPTVPALSVAVATSEGPIYANAHGRADIEAHIPATADTRFYIASSTKSFVGLTMALLDARGAIDLDWTLAELAPDIAFRPELRAGEVTLRHLLSHTHGLRGRMIEFRLAFSGEHDPETLWRLLGRLEPNAEQPLGSFRYGNLGYNVAAMLVERRLRRPWQELVETEVIRPLGLTRTITRGVAEARARGEIAVPYDSAVPDGPVRRYLAKEDDTMQSAGGMFSTARDLARWLQVNLAAARGGGALLPAAVVASTHQPIGRLDDNFEMFRRNGYGLGWYSGDFGGANMYHSFGGFTGARAHVSFVPERDLGVAVTTNDEGIGFALADIVAVYAYDWFLRGPEQASANARAILDRMEPRAAERIAAAAADRARRAARTWQLTRPRSAYAGRYCSPDFGTLVIAETDGALAMRMGRLRATLDPFTEPDTARVEPVPGSGEVLRFRVENNAVVGAEGLNTSFVRCP
jgi:CubicO group peptidase (beta-lactamase class C family)